jgi:hypothetical protein
MTIINDIRNEARMGWSLLSDPTKAAIRTGLQTVQAAVAITLFAFASAVVSWASGADVNVLDVVATGRAAIGAAALTALASFRAYFMNRGDKGARYS